MFYNMMSGATAGAISISTTYPLGYARTRLATDVGAGHRDFKGSLDCLKTTFQQNGIRGLYNGFGIACFGVLPYRGIYFGLYDTLSAINPYKTDKGILGIASTMTVAQFVSIFAGLASYP